MAPTSFDERLWKKESDAVDASFVDLFANETKSSDLKEWDRKLKNSDFKTVFYYEEYNPRKNTKTSDFLRFIGNKMFVTKDWLNAMEYYSAALCFAEYGSNNVSFAYANRAACFLNMDRYDECLRDIKLAEQANYPYKEKLMERKAKCLHFMPKKTEEEKGEKLSFEPSVNFPCMANVLEVRRNEEFGRHVIATCDIEVGKTVLIESAYCSLGQAPDRFQCYTCTKEEANFIPCPKCTDVMFCNEECRNENIIHKKFCGANINRMPSDIRFIAESLLLGIMIFSSANEVISFVEGTLANRNTQVPNAINDSQSKYRQFLNLAPAKNRHSFKEIYQVFTGILDIPSIKKMFRTKHSQRFLMHLVAEHRAIMANNSFGKRVPNGLISMKLGLVISLFNHKCAPNISNRGSNDDPNVSIFKTSRPIKKGEQLFINYLIESSAPTYMRRQYLSKGYDFICKCDKCEPHCKPSDRRKMKSDPNFQFLASLSKEQYYSASVKQKCEEFLTQFGRLPWSEELDRVLNVYNP
ncbi:SET and MYND domain-containing protein DDB_G0273589-like [Bradysia coprophila]|uniref:SET and MYND domain-containing protein DDB_G0273589-like n=1 Tax=Bradysia coprophila TaxID=38358 RepID=UPI00187DB7EE|nr:SET and MYND domain-containing protein DDB_G0273589-like [Bradysia coprophila]